MSPLRIFFVAGVFSVFPFEATQAVIVAPYTADANTLHLWHFDEADPGPVVPAAGVTGSFNLVADGGRSGTPASNGAAGFAGFGSAGQTTAGSGAGFKGSAVPITSVTGANGAFTFEAMIRTSNISDLQMVMSMEGNNIAERPFQFRISNGSLNFINIFGGGTDPLVAIPTSGPDGFAPNEWFHVAATYNGDEASLSDNFKLYWTRVDPGRTAANEIGSFVMDADLAGDTLAFGAANDYRTSGTGNQSNLEGQIDEIRISDIARGAGEMIFTVPEPSSIALVSLAGLTMLRRRRSISRQSN